MTEARLSFIVDYYDPQAGLVRKYQLCYFTTDDTIEMHDIKNRRIFLKRCQFPGVKPSDLHLGAVVTIYSRKLTVVEYADDATKQLYASESDVAVMVIHQLANLGIILQYIQSAGLRIVNLNMLVLTQAEVEEFNPEYTREWAGNRVVVAEIAGKDIERIWKEGRMVQSAWLGGVETGRGDAAWFFGPGSARVDRSPALMRNCTIGIIKPHAVNQYGGRIIQDIVDEGFEITALKKLSLDKADAVDFLEVYKGVISEYSALTEHLSSGPCWVLEITAEDPVQSFRELCGPHDPDIGKVLRPNSLRAKYGETRVKNAIHCTDLPEDGVLESDFFFNLLRPMSS
eukprot:TRINITY_DN9626_c0_g1_i2.p1 TRINITY_DN9626_c0_g1~~TRINITY_DN9626_c0_g1_i2.p1  ORF type:complete len:342 (+),score=57.96 TRINITY_DN9626_c0_g1_i2:252-1277(+)